MGLSESSIVISSVPTAGDAYVMVPSMSIFEWLIDEVLIFYVVDYSLSSLDGLG